MSIKGLAILDDQANITMIDPSIITKLKIRPSDVKQTYLSTTTIQGTSYPEPCELADGLIASAIDGQNPIPLPKCYVNEHLPNAIDEVPSKEAVASIQGLQHLQSQFPIKENWPTIALIGRDCKKWS